MQCTLSTHTKQNSADSPGSNTPRLPDMPLPRSLQGLPHHSHGAQAHTSGPACIIVKHSQRQHPMQQRPHEASTLLIRKPLQGPALPRVRAMPPVAYAPGSSLPTRHDAPLPHLTVPCLLPTSVSRLPLATSHPELSSNTPHWAATANSSRRSHQAPTQKKSPLPASPAHTHTCQLACAHCCAQAGAGHGKLPVQHRDAAAHCACAPTSALYSCAIRQS